MGWIATNDGFVTFAANFGLSPELERALDALPKAQRQAVEL